MEGITSILTDKIDHITHIDKNNQIWYLYTGEIEDDLIILKCENDITLILCYRDIKNGECIPVRKDDLNYFYKE